MEIGQVKRHGDVIIKRVKAMPVGEKTEVKKENQAVILAYGEVTGHKHQILERDVNLFEIELAGGIERYLEVREESCNLLHEEHSTINLPTGNYKIGIQKEYSPEEIRNVAD